MSRSNAPNLTKILLSSTDLSFYQNVSYTQCPDSSWRWGFSGWRESSSLFHSNSLSPQNKCWGLIASCGDHGIQIQLSLLKNGAKGATSGQQCSSPCSTKFLSSIAILCFQCIGSTLVRVSNALFSSSMLPSILASKKRITSTDSGSTKSKSPIHDLSRKTS